jgi:cation transport regulator ChaC
MADGWEKLQRCKSRTTAVLHGHSRAFDKASIESRGTREHPAPTLRVVPSKDDCHGVAFEFDDHDRDSVMADLLEREGKTFPLREKRIRLLTKVSVNALVPIYEGKRIIKYGSLRELAQMAILARGTRGNGVDYVRNIAAYLDANGIEDKTVSGFLDEIELCLRHAKADRCHPR